MNFKWLIFEGFLDFQVDNNSMFCTKVSLSCQFHMQDSSFCIFNFLTAIGDIFLLKPQLRSNSCLDDDWSNKKRKYTVRDYCSRKFSWTLPCSYPEKNWLQVICPHQVRRLSSIEYLHFEPSADQFCFLFL